jgi:hypothetical protein
MRPWVGESITLAQFELVKDVKLVLCRAGEERLGEVLFEVNPSPEALDQHIWNEISRGFARPVSREDQDAAYVPTQIIAEAFKVEGFDGIAYQSGLAKGTNVVLFDRKIARLANRFLYSLKKVRYDFEAVPNCGIWRRREGQSGEYLEEIHTESP